MSRIAFRVPDFVADGVMFSEIEIVVEMDSDIRDAVRIAEALNVEAPVPTGSNTADWHKPT